MKKITEIIPDNMPDWARKAMAEGNFFNAAIRQVEKAQIEALGWAYADACMMADKGVDIRKVEVPTILSRFKEDFSLTCTWVYHPDSSRREYWKGECGGLWVFMGGGPLENEMHFCPSCGKEVSVGKEDA